MPPCRTTLRRERERTAEARAVALLTQRHRQRGAAPLHRSREWVAAVARGPHTPTLPYLGCAHHSKPTRADGHSGPGHAHAHGGGGGRRDGPHLLWAGIKPGCQPPMTRLGHRRQRITLRGG